MPPEPTVHALTVGAPNLLQGAWPDRCYTHIMQAELHCFRPVGTPRARVLLCAGGGYVGLAYDREGAEVAAWLAEAGYEVCVLVHRLPGAEPVDSTSTMAWASDIALQDGKTALALMASFPPLSLLLMGLSSGGHLAGVLACQPEAQAAVGLVIAYAPLNANHRDYKAPAGKPDFAPPQKQAFYNDWPIGITREPQGLPPQPVFLAYALHDAIVPIEHALNFIRTARDAGLHLDAHIFHDAPHGFALRELDGAQRAWPTLALDWMARRLATANP